MEEKKFQLKKSYLYPIVLLEDMLSSSLRRRLYRLTVGMLLFFLAFVSLIRAGMYFQRFDVGIAVILRGLIPRLFGVVLILLFFWIVVFCLEAFFRSYYFKEDETETLNGANRIPEDMFSFHTLHILLGDKSGDITRAFIASPVGWEILRRAGISDEKLDSFMVFKDTTQPYSYPDVEMGKVFTVIDLAEYIFSQDRAFVDFLFDNAVQKDDFLGATKWVVNRLEKAKHQKRWWTLEHLETIEGIGSSWSYGQTYVLNKFARELSGFEGGSYLNSLSEKGKMYVRQLKDLLSRGRETNVMLVGDPGEGKIDILSAFCRDVHSGNVPSSLEHKKVMILDGEYLVSCCQEKSDLEHTLIKIFNDAVTAGNIILIIDNFPGFVLSAKAFGCDVVNFLDPYLGSSELQLIVITDKENYHQILEQEPVIKQRFERVVIESPDNDEVVTMLEGVAEKLELHSGVVFTYGALKETVKAVTEHFTDAIVPDKSIDIIVELPALVLRKHKFLVEKQDVYDVVKTKTGVSIGKIDESERNTLVNMEKMLHDRVIGQDEAITFVSNAMRRSRAGIRNTKKPIGSFLFIGPTGVGKTETAKALAQLFFGSETNMSRLDMSEFSGEDALKRLIGEGSHVGLLTKTLKERPYGVVLLDEFEKSATQVHDLFLQILDEGFYSDMKGTRVNAHDVIFIATSNAGSNLIFKRLEEKAYIENIHKEVIEYIIGERIFKPEFLNRFDAVVLFHPLDDEHLKKIASIMLDKFRERLRTRGLKVEITQEVLDYVAKQGVDPIFGARPMNRYIQEHVEQAVADKLIRGEIKEGSVFTLSIDDIS
jgi:ATP-dependent Clp protease ATP-binding subunit ClpC